MTSTMYSVMSHCSLNDAANAPPPTSHARAVNSSIVETGESEVTTAWGGAMLICLFENTPAWLIGIRPCTKAEHLFIASATGQHGIDRIVGFGIGAILSFSLLRR
jgi:hypothetical protein